MSLVVFHAITVKIPMTFFTDIGQSILKFIQKHKRPQKAKAILSKMSNAGGTTIPDFNIHFRDKTIKTA
jgi:hypothetical protein